MMGTTERGEKARELLMARAGTSSCGILPLGSQSQIARETGLTRARVQQIAADLDLDTSRTSRVDRGCAACGKPMKRYSPHPGVKQRRGPRQYCAACSYVDVACDQCGNLFKRSVGRLTSSANSERYTGGRQFCNHRCQGRYLTGRPRPVRRETP